MPLPLYGSGFLFSRIRQASWPTYTRAGGTQPAAVAVLAAEGLQEPWMSGFAGQEQTRKQSQQE